MDIDASAYTGSWINWSKGRVLGATLTLTNQDASILNSAVTIFIQISGTFSWMVFCYILHQWRTKQGAFDGLYHQHQAILRNGGSDLSVLWQLWGLAGSWHGLVPRVKRRSTSLAMTCIIHVAIFSALGIFTSRLTQTGNETLIQGVHCGKWDPLNDAVFSDLNTAQAYDVQVTHNLAVAQRQVQSCSAAASLADQACNVFVSNITHEDKTVPCPFPDASMCNTEGNQAFQLDTGAMNSHAHLGINARPKDRVSMRQLATCAPIKLDGYVLGPFNQTVASDNTGNPSGIRVAYWNYGPTGYSNYTYEVTNWRQYFPQVKPQQAPAYQLDLVTTYESDIGHQPISNLSVPSADLEMLFLQNQVWYAGPVDDPWFSAHQVRNLSATITNQYTADNAAVSLGCAVQFQMCSLGQGAARCSDLQGLDVIRETIMNNTLEFNDEQMTSALRILNATNQAAIAPVVRAFGADLMVANLKTGSGFTSSALPPDQWQIELQNIYNLVIVSFQRAVMQYASGPQADLRPFTVKADNAAERHQCGSQIMRRSDFTNFSILSLGLIGAIGILLALMTLFLEPVLYRIQLRSPHGRFRNLRWERDNLLELQRMAYEADGLGVWRPGGRDSANRMPVTEKYERFTFAESKKVSGLSGLGMSMGRARSGTFDTDTPTAYVGEQPKNVDEYIYRQLPAPPMGIKKVKTWWRR